MEDKSDYGTPWLTIALSVHGDAPLNHFQRGNGVVWMALLLGKADTFSSGAN